VGNNYHNLYVVLNRHRQLLPPNHTYNVK